MYLGKSPRHARNVGLVLNPATGMVSPQYHLRYDDTFETARGIETVRGIREASHGKWRSKCYFVDLAVTTKSTKKEPEKIIKKKITEERQQDTVAPQGEEMIEESAVPIDAGPKEIFAADDPVVTNEPPTGENEGAPADNVPPAPQPTRRSARSWKPTQRMIESIMILTYWWHCTRMMIKFSSTLRTQWR
jgi:hypothetical protein